MRSKLPVLLALCLSLATAARAELPADEAGAIAYLKAKGVEIFPGPDGKPKRLQSSGKEGLTPEDYALMARLTTLEQMGLNAAPLTGDQWGFLQAMTGLKSLSIWHGHHFATLEPFCGLKVESLTIGGCMGLRDLNKDNPDRLRDAILTLRDLPNLKKGNWYHSPLAPDDTHLAHIAREFPTLEELRLDFTAPRGSETTITPHGLAELQKLPLKLLSVENPATLTADHFKALAGIRTLTTLLIDARRSAVDPGAVAAFRAARPEVEVVVADRDAPGPPMPARK
ncbi:MAG: hypothetical protein KDM91_18020 [Verrucomicrobiae bacterium]|nr:hypothetical protein [Verrucomicrobiae bacterium]MCP5541745.1 hypothetical protein [Akkermansiaceae bacterium]MCP5551614.1 hypothetical protein [Akkermansiaceae bacterium]